MSGRRPPRAAQPPKGKTYEDMVACEEAGNHEVHPATWPPMRTGESTAQPHVSCICVKCGTNLIVYSGHASGDLEGVDVVLPKAKTVNA